MKKYKIKVESTSKLSERELVTFNNSDTYDVVTMIHCDNGQCIVIKSDTGVNVMFEEIKEEAEAF
ncbi:MULTISPECIES: hypothetical protein [unclassified Staphylococcus]|uniref:hypothetical protein n=1 Tax=unclassified Staphylococcus TaxID=91994 RepID=UPI0021CED65E|nr:MULTISPECIES: hypothetical protein [unclassified Staphylococcus]UXR79072.1 hypothetical protein MUA92_04065 [Staphylococcus sp. IVB6227]UXR81831.1 hypothetical protein MUA51_06960 [Staphylococcus sp. IVB6214]